ncbi:hypothetical protein HNV11_16035 [Spirosoma taeanense]|uniref:Uncharacterized protein n=1 Tax=Spirosoma taeanense TaxID=2735870 RepID=A0A6M5YBW4_9BACT|nr:hypothetical protein [Spirosoma taeanense]QJW90780.1 hypothetical protein HNV11_16035 [Spirosoma taeanense]
MARQDPQIEYIVTQEAYETACNSLPKAGTDNQKAQSVNITARQYRQNTSQTINAGKWVLWSIGPESFEFTWSNGAWQPPANLVILNR